MSPGKHGPNRLGNYIAIHQNVMDQFIRHGDFVRQDGLVLTDMGGGYLQLAGVIECVNGIYITVTKDLRILAGEGQNATVQTENYSYNAVIGKLGNLLRYDSPHPTHNREHHVHRYDPLIGDTEGTVTFLADENSRPTLGEVVGEVEAWYWAHLDEVIRRSLG